MVRDISFAKRWFFDPLMSDLRPALDRQRHTIDRPGRPLGLAVLSHLRRLFARNQGMGTGHRLWRRFLGTGYHCNPLSRTSIYALDRRARFLCSERALRRHLPSLSTSLATSERCRGSKDTTRFAPRGIRLLVWLVPHPGTPPEAPLYTSQKICRPAQYTQLRASCRTERATRQSRG